MSINRADADADADANTNAGFVSSDEEDDMDMDVAPSPMVTNLVHCSTEPPIVATSLFACLGDDELDTIFDHLLYESPLSASIIEVVTTSLPRLLIPEVYSALKLLLDRCSTISEVVSFDTLDEIHTRWHDTVTSWLKKYNHTTAGSLLKFRRIIDKYFTVTLNDDETRISILRQSRKRLWNRAMTLAQVCRSAREYVLNMPLWTECSTPQQPLGNGWSLQVRVERPLRTIRPCFVFDVSCKNEDKTRHFRVETTIEPSFIRPLMAYQMSEARFSQLGTAYNLDRLSSKVTTQTAKPIDFSVKQAIGESFKFTIMPYLDLVRYEQGTAIQKHNPTCFAVKVSTDTRGFRWPRPTYATGMKYVKMDNRLGIRTALGLDVQVSSHVDPLSTRRVLPRGWGKRRIDDSTTQIELDAGRARRRMAFAANMSSMNMNATTVDAACVVREAEALEELREREQRTTELQRGSISPAAPAAPAAPPAPPAPPPAPPPAELHEPCTHPQSECPIPCDNRPFRKRQPPCTFASPVPSPNMYPPSLPPVSRRTDLVSDSEDEDE